MCFFLTIAVPEAHAERMQETFGGVGGGFELRAMTNVSVLSALPSRFAARFLTLGGCSCDLYARPRASHETDADAEAHLRRKYAKRGWSEAKIARAIEQTSATAGARTATSGLREDVIELLLALCDAAGSVAVFVHWYSGDVNDERIGPATAVRTCRCGDLRERARDLREGDVLVAVSSGHTRR